MDQLFIKLDANSNNVRIDIEPQLIPEHGARGRVKIARSLEDKSTDCPELVIVRDDDIFSRSSNSVAKPLKPFSEIQNPTLEDRRARFELAVETLLPCGAWPHFAHMIGRLKPETRISLVAKNTGHPDFMGTDIFGVREASLSRPKELELFLELAQNYGLNSTKRPVKITEDWDKKVVTAVKERSKWFLD